MANVTPVGGEHTPKMKKKLRALCLLLLSDEDKKKFGISCDADVEQWWEAGAGKLHRDSSPIEFELNNAMFAGMVPQLYAILRDCLLSHRWHEAVHVLTGFLLPKYIPTKGQHIFETVHQVGLEVFYQNGQETNNQLQQLVQLLKTSPYTVGVNVRKIIHDYVLYLLTQKMTNEAKQEFQSVLRWQLAKIPETTTNKQIEQLYIATQALVHYMEWLVLLGELQSLEHDLRDAHFTRHSDAVKNLQDSMRGTYEKAVSLFKAVCQEPGTWDICIVKLIEMYEYYEEIEALENVLKNYAATNTDNPNVLKYLLHFFQKYHKDEKQLLREPLQKLCQMVPSDEMCLNYYGLLCEDGAPVQECIEVLFNMLDYKVWQTKPQPWQKLAQQLLEIKECGDEGSKNALEQCWACRANWWPSYHFETQGLESQLIHSVEDFLVHRAVVAACVIGPDNKFTKIVEKHVTNRRHKEIFQRILDIPLSSTAPSSSHSWT